jgi:hypothetical protein
LRYEVIVHFSAEIGPSADSSSCRGGNAKQGVAMDGQPARVWHAVNSVWPRAGPTLQRCPLAGWPRAGLGPARAGLEPVVRHGPGPTRRPALGFRRRKFGPRRRVNARRRSTTRRDAWPCRRSDSICSAARPSTDTSASEHQRRRRLLGQGQHESRFGSHPHARSHHPPMVASDNAP